jgi:hypothetical protein
MIRASAVLLAFFALGPAASADVKAGGYFSLDFYLGQAASPAPQGSLENIQCGVLLSGSWTERLGYALEIRSREGMRFEMEQAWVGLLWSEAVQVKLGLFLVPFGRLNTSARPFETPFVLTPLPVGAAFPASWRELGVLAEGKSGSFRYAAYVGNGLAEARDFASGQQFRDNNKNKAWGGRLDFMLGNAFEIGGSYYSGRVSDDDGRLLTMKGADVLWADRGFKLAAEYCRSDVANPAPFGAGKAEGYFILGSFDLGGVSPVVSFQKFVYDDAFHGEGFGGPLIPGLGIFENRRVWSIGLTAELAAGVVLKAEYAFNKEPDNELKNDIFRAQVAARF